VLGHVEVTAEKKPFYLPSQSYIFNPQKSNSLTH